MSQFLSCRTIVFCGSLWLVGYTTLAKLISVRWVGWWLVSGWPYFSLGSVPLPAFTLTLSGRHETLKITTQQLISNFVSYILRVLLFDRIWYTKDDNYHWALPTFTLAPPGRHGRHGNCSTKYKHLNVWGNVPVRVCATTFFVRRKDYSRLTCTRENTAQAIEEKKLKILLP